MHPYLVAMATALSTRRLLTPWRDVASRSRVAIVILRCVSLQGCPSRQGNTSPAWAHGTIAAGCPARIRGDALRLQQVLGNLLSNACKFTHSGEIRLHVQPVPARRDDKRHWLRFTVSDTGPGIPAERIGELFEPFTQQDDSISRTHGGTGLGLTISRQLVELMGGRIDVESRLGSGSQFIVQLPFDAAQTTPTLDTPPPLRHSSAPQATHPGFAATLSTAQADTLRELIDSRDSAARQRLAEWFPGGLPPAVLLLQQDLDAFDFDRAARRLQRIRERVT